MGKSIIGEVPHNINNKELTHEQFLCNPVRRKHQIQLHVILIVLLSVATFSHFFSLGVVVQFLKAMGFSKKSNGVMRIFTDQLNSDIKKYADKHDIRIFWWPNLGGGKNGAKLDFVQQEFAKAFKGMGNHVFCILTDTEHVQTVASREFTTKKGKNIKICTNA